MEQLELTNFFKTKAQANDFSTRLAVVIQRLYENDFGIESALTDIFGIQKKDSFMALLRAHNVTIDRVDALKIFLIKVQDAIAKLPVLDITVAFEPHQKNLQAVSDWFLINLKKQILLNVTVDRHIIGGAKISYQGKYIDASIKPIYDALVMPPPPPATQPEKVVPQTQPETQKPPLQQNTVQPQQTHG